MKYLRELIDSAFRSTQSRLAAGQHTGKGGPKGQHFQGTKSGLAPVTIALAGCALAAWALGACSGEGPVLAFSTQMPKESSVNADPEATNTPFPRLVVNIDSFHLDAQVPDLRGLLYNTAFDDPNWLGIWAEAQPPAAAPAAPTFTG